MTTAVTNLDIHDIARSSRTFGADRYYIVTPVEEQQKLVQKIILHWQSGWGATYNPKRKAALDIVSIIPSVSDALEDMEARVGRKPKIVVTGASAHSKAISSARAYRVDERRGSDFSPPFWNRLGNDRGAF